MVKSSGSGWVSAEASPTSTRVPTWCRPASGARRAVLGQSPVPKSYPMGFSTFNGQQKGSGGKTPVAGPHLFRFHKVIICKFYTQRMSSSKKRVFVRASSCRRCHQRLGPPIETYWETLWVSWHLLDRWQAQISMVWSIPLVKSWSRCSQDAGADIADMREQGDGEGDSAWASGPQRSPFFLMGKSWENSWEIPWNSVAGAAVNSMIKQVCTVDKFKIKPK